MIPHQRRRVEKEKSEEKEEDRREMATQLHRPTAKIYAFPAGGRAPPTRYREMPRPAHAPVARLPGAERKVRVQHGTSWYHEEAVTEET